MGLEGQLRQRSGRPKAIADAECAETISPTSASIEGPPSRIAAWLARRSGERDALVRLTPFGWAGGLRFVFGFWLASFLLYGYFVVYWRNADMDFMVVYSALSLNDGAEQAYFDHPAYLTILSVKNWFRFLHQLRLLGAWTLSDIPSPDNSAAFDAAMTSAIRAGRIVALLTTGGIVVAFAMLVRRMVDDRRIAMCAVFAFAMSGGIQMHLRILRSEMLAAGFCTIALLLLILAAQRATVWRPLVLGVAGCLCMLGLENKVQAILLIGFIPMMVLPFAGAGSASVPFWRTGAGAWLCAAMAVFVAATAGMAAWPLIADGFDADKLSAAGLTPLVMGTAGAYQAALLVWTMGCMIAFAVMSRVSLWETVASAALALAGAALALLALRMQYHPANVAAVLNPLEKMMGYVDAPEKAGNPIGALGLLFSGFVGVLRRYTFILFSSPRPAVFLTWLVVPGIVYAWRRNNRQVACQAAVLMLAAVTIDALGVRRGLKLEYFVFTDPLIIIAGMLLLARLDFVRFLRATFPIGAALIGLHIVLGQAEPVKMLTKRSGPENICEWQPGYLPNLRLPWCASQKFTSS